MRFTGDTATGRLLGVQLFGHRQAEVAKRIDIAATAIFHSMTVDEMSDLDLSYTPPLGSPVGRNSDGRPVVGEGHNHQLKKKRRTVDTGGIMRNIGSNQRSEERRPGKRWAAYR